MLRSLITWYVRRTKNASFAFDRNISSAAITSFACRKAVEYVRGMFLFGLRKRVFIGRGAAIYHKSHLSAGTNVILGDHVRLSCLGNEGMSIGNNVNIGAYTQIIVSAGLGNLGKYVRLGSNVGIGEFSYIGGGGGVEIGDDVIVGQYFSVHPENHIYKDESLPIRLSGVSRQGVVIGNNCWIGSKVTVLDGVHIGDNCVIAAGAVVTKSVPSNSVAAGVPALVINSVPSMR